MECDDFAQSAGPCAIMHLSIGVQAMKRVWVAASAVALCFSLRTGANELQREVVSVDYTKEKGLVAAAYQGGEVVVWEVDSGQVKRVFNASAAKNTWNTPLAQFGLGGRRLAFTQEGDAGLVSYELDTGKSTVLVPRRLLVRGITAFSWSHMADTMLVSIGRDIFLIEASGHLQWQRRLETRAIITDVVWHPSEKFYTVATDNGEVSTWETSSGRLIAASKMEAGAQAVPVRVGWTDENSLMAEVRGASLSVLDPETLKPRKATACNCLDFTWSASGKEIFAWAPPNIALFSEAGQRMRELRTNFDGKGPIAWADEGSILTAASDSTVVLRDLRSSKILRTFALPDDKKLSELRAR
jgi:WD40 repeat protein